jgi:hypothetical protein
MGSYYLRANFSLRPQYSIDLDVTTSFQTSGGVTGTVVNVVANGVKHTTVNNAPTSTGSPRSYNVPNGRVTNVNGTVTATGSDSAWAFTFTTGAVPQIQPIWSGFNRYVRHSDASTISVSVSASHSLLGDATATISSIPHVHRITFNGNGGTASATSTDVDSGTFTPLPSASRSGFTFNGWYTASSGGSFVGGAGDVYFVSATTTLFAQWSVQYSPASITDGVANRSYRVGDSVYEYVAATNTNSTLGTGGASFSLSTSIPGISLTDYGSYAEITGIVGATSTSNYSVSVTALGPGGNASSTGSWSISQALPSWTDTTLASGRKNVAYSSTFRAANATSWNISGVPPGLSASGTTGAMVTISGTPTGFGSYSITATPRNSDNTDGDTQIISFNILDASLSWTDQILATSLATQGISYSDGVSVASGPVVTYSIFSGSLPPGVSLNSSTGAITGTPTTAGTYNFAVRATNGSSETINTSTLTITVAAAGGYVKVWNGSSWANGTAYVRQSGQWVQGTVQIRNGGNWGNSFSN